MRIKSLSLTNFRNIKNSKVEFRGKNISGIYGPNGTGKTSVIEAIKLLKVYFSTPKEIKNKSFLEAEKEKISDYIYQGEKYLEIALELEKKEEIYLIELALALNDFDGIMALKEISFSAFLFPRKIDFVEKRTFKHSFLFLLYLSSLKKQLSVSVI